VNKKYNWVTILSDMQGWIGDYCPVASFLACKNKFKVNPFIYSFDLKGYGSMQFPEPNVFALAGFSEKVFDIMKLLEQDKKALYDGYSGGTVLGFGHLLRHIY
jgi:60 kDa SS-A/Ro ribonucleoprotein